VRRLGSAALTVLLALGAAPAGGAGQETPTAPGFRVTLLDSARVIDSRELTGKVMVLRFQASYCQPCARESAAFGRLIERYRRRGVEFLAVHVQDTLPDTRRFIRTHNVGYPVALDPRLVIGNQFGFKGTPYTVVVDRRGEMVARIHGASAVARLPRILEDALRQGAPPVVPK
jgi:cytochrome c biogenesis protein CcmG, thiol:disulfide interchange protein DsbE